MYVTNPIVPFMFANQNLKDDDDPWWTICDVIDGFNHNRKEYVAASINKFLTNPCLRGFLVPIELGGCHIFHS